AIDAMRSAAAAHQHFGMDELGRPVLVETRGNPDTHLVLRGGNQGPNFDAASVAAARSALDQAGVDAAIMVDCSHANRGKDPQRQPAGRDEVDPRSPGRGGTPAGGDARERPVRWQAAVVRRVAVWGFHYRWLPGLGRDRAAVAGGSAAVAGLSWGAVLRLESFAPGAALLQNRAMEHIHCASALAGKKYQPPRQSLPAGRLPQ